jgi:hypothetical protein
MAKLPWLDYTGQTTAELLACKETHRIDSLLCAFEQAIQAKGETITEEETLVLAVKALDREVNNGGYSQFFVNSSRRYAPIIADCLRRIGCTATFEITTRALAATGEARDAILNACDQEYYKLNEITPNLFRFVEQHADRIQLAKAVLPPPRKPTPLSTASKLHIKLTLSKQRVSDMDAARSLAREIVQKSGMAASDSDIEAAAALYAFTCAVAAADLDAAERAAPAAFELMRDDTSHCVIHRKWVELAIDAARWGTADAATLAYLKYLQGCDRSEVGTKNRILYWGVLLQKAPGMLPKSEQYFAEAFPDVPRK